MHLEVRHLELVAAIADEGGVTKAGNRLHLTQSALSHQLRDIEAKLGVQLFQRMNKRMVLTPAGERVLGSARVVLDELRRAEDDIRNTTEMREGVLRISTECSTCYHWLPNLLKRFNEQFPRVEVRIVVEATNYPFPPLLEGELDLAIVHTRIQNARVSYKPLFRDELVVAMRPDHRLSRRPYIAPEDFAAENLIVYAIPKEETLLFREVLIPAGVRPRNVMHIQLTEAIIELVKAGAGISVMAGWVVEPEVRSGTLQAVRLTRNGLRRRWFAATIRSHTLPAYVPEFARLLAAEAAPAGIKTIRAARNRARRVA